MEELSPSGSSPGDSPAGGVFGAWGRWWVRIPLFLAHLALLASALSLAPGDYAFQLGATIGGVIVVGTVFLWLLLWFARTRRLVLLFCGLVLAQTGITTLVALNLRSAARVLGEIEAGGIQRQQQAEAQLASFHLERLSEMLTPGNEFHPKELPSLLGRVRSAKAKVRELQADGQSWLREAEKRVAAVNARKAANFRRGIESERERSEQTRKVSEDYFTGIEKVVTLLIDRQGHYRSTTAGLVFDRPQDADAYNQMLGSLTTMEQQLNAARARNPGRLNTGLTPSQ